MKTYLYLSTAIVGVMIVGNAWAQCVSTQDCATLGYTETSCPNGNGVKCPFGNKWFCGESSCDYVCENLGFKYTCSGKNLTGGNDVACGGKYKSCNCASPYEWKSGSCSCPNEYKYNCSASDQITGGEGTSCNGKYKSCKCKTGYGWKDGSCVQMVCAKTFQTGFTCPASCSVNGNTTTIKCTCGACPGSIINVSGGARPGEIYTVIIDHNRLSYGQDNGCHLGYSSCSQFHGICTICQEWKFPD